MAGLVLAAAGISLAATGIIVLARPDRSITLLVYLPGIVIVEALFGVGGGVAAVLLSVAGSAWTRMQFLQDPLRNPMGFYATWEEELILLVVGLFVVALMEMRRRSGARMASGAHQLAALLENIGDAVIVFDREMRVASMNPAAHAMLDRPGETVVGESAEALRGRFGFIPVSGAEPVPLETAVAQGVPVHEQGTIVDFERNRRIHVMVSMAPLRGAGKEIEGALIMLTDVTTLKELQLRTLEDARHAAVAQMASGLSHDFNHVLDIVRRAVAVLELRADADPAERRKYLEMIDRAAVDGSAIVRRLRDYLAGGGPKAAAVDLREVAHEAVELTRPLWRERPGLEVLEDLHSVPAVQGSADDLRRVLTNLLFNAIEALSAGGGRITVHTGLGDGAKPDVVAWVEDDGPGIPPDVRARLFTPYFTTKSRGLGMGLFGAQRIALAHGGSLRFSRIADKASRFTLALPREAGPASAAAGPHEAGAGVKS